MMDDKDKFSGLMQLAELKFKEFDTRRSYEWKISFGLWAAILGTAPVLGQFDLPSTALCITVPASILVVGVYWVLWLQPLTYRNKRTQKEMYEFEREAETVLSSLSDERDQWYREGRLLPRFWWGTIFQLVVTISLLAIINALLLLRALRATDAGA